MYVSLSRPATGGGTGRRTVAGNVIALGAVSLVTDISSEMVTAVLPLYLVLGLGLSPLQFGFLDGLYAGVTALVRLAGGHSADRWRRHKLVAGIGYGLSAVAKLGLLVAGSVVGALGAVLAADRAGKGIRTAPRDALISLSSRPDQLGRAFGVHRAMDTVGALLGPVVAFAILSVSLGAYDAVFVTSFCVAALGVLVLVLFVRDHRPASTSVPVAGPGLRDSLGLLRQPTFRRMCRRSTLLGLATVSDAFIYLLLQQHLDLPVQYFPLLPLGTAAVYLLLAIPLGRVADRFGRWRVFMGGHAALLTAYLLILQGDTVLLLVALALHGGYYAATDGVLMATASPTVPEELRSSGLALIQTGQALGRLAGSIAFGALWTLWGPQPALVLATVGLAATCLIFRREKTA